MKKSFQLFSFFLSSCSILGMLCCINLTDGAKKNGATSFNIREGQRLFIHYCSPCHGEKAEGSGRYFPTPISPQPPDFINSDYLLETSEKTLFTAIKFGSKALGKSSYSPSYGKTLRDEEIYYIIEFLEFFKTIKGR